MSLLIVRCPLKPFPGAVSASSSDWQDLAYAERFEWCLIDGLADSLGSVSEGESPAPLFGVSTTESMPYADEALVLLPTLDVRLIDAKVPLANPKKLQQILPNLIEDYVLTGAESISVQAFPPVSGNPVLQRTLALIDRSWFSWLSNQLERLLAPRVRLIPECLLLNFTGDGKEGFVAYQRVDNNIIFTQRIGLQLGVSWVELISSTGNEQALEVPQSLTGLTLREISWDWFVPAACDYLQINGSSLAPNFALNLLPKTFKRNIKSSGKGSFSYFAGVLSGRPFKDSAATMGLAWMDPFLWRQPFNWLRYLILSLVLGQTAYLSWLTLDNWRWGHQIELLAVQSLTPASVAALNQSKLGDHGVVILNTFTKQVTLEQRRQGISVEADFSAMAAKLQQLKMAFGPEILQKIDYDGYNIIFEFKPSVLNIKPEEVLARARSLGMAVKYLGSNRYQMDAYAGLGSEI